MKDCTIKIKKKLKRNVYFTKHKSNIKHFTKQKEILDININKACTIQRKTLRKKIHVKVIE